MTDLLHARAATECALPVLEDAAYLAGGLMPTDASAAGAFIAAI